MTKKSETPFVGWTFGEDDRGVVFVTMPAGRSSVEMTPAAARWFGQQVQRCADHAQRNGQKAPPKPRPRVPGRGREDVLCSICHADRRAAQHVQVHKMDFHPFKATR